ncbi:MAG: phosphotransferase family protein, partial [Blastocatellia bacterium]|nr:phosphotransferase family protein [Blastocatellia bacterium]
ALFKIAVIAQQIYLRYKQGFSKDDRFGQLINGIRVLASRAIRTIDKGHVE